MNKSFPLTRSAIKTLYRKNRARVFLMGGLLFLFTLLLKLLMPVTFVGEALYKEGRDRKASSSLLDINLGKEPTHSRASLLMCSNTILDPVIRKCGLQVKIEPSNIFEKGFVRIKNAVYSEMGLPFSGENGWKFRDVIFTEASPFRGVIRVLDQATFLVLDGQGLELLSGECGIRCQSDTFSFLLESIPAQAVGKDYRISFLTREKCLNQVQKNLKIFPKKQAPDLLKISFCSTDQHLASLVVNEVLEGYEQFLLEDLKRSVELESRYFEAKRSVWERDWKQSLDGLALYQSNKMKGTGILTLEKHRDLLLNPFSRYVARLAEIEIEMARLLVASPDNPLSILSADSLGFFKEAALEIERLKKSQELFALTGKQFTTFMAPQLGLKEDRLTALSDSPFVQAYLTEYPELSLGEGLDLEGLQQLYAVTSEKLQQRRGYVEALALLKTRMKEDKDPLSLLCSKTEERSLSDLFQQALSLELRLKDEDTLLGQEREGILRQLGNLRGFANEYLQQKLSQEEREIHVLSKQAFLLLEKLYSRIEDRVSLFSSQSKRAISLASTQLEQERRILQRKIEEISADLASCPKEWALEKELTLKAELAMEVLGAVAVGSEKRLAEISLGRHESSIIDLCLPVRFAAWPGISVIAPLMGIFGWGWMLLFLILKAHVQGKLVSAQGLALVGRNSLSIGSTMIEIDALRSACRSIYKERSPLCQVVTIFIKPALDPSEQMALLLGRRGLKVLLIQIPWIQDLQIEEGGLLSYFNHQPYRIQKREGYDLLSRGGGSSFVPDMISSLAFIDLINKLKIDYDLLLIASEGGVDALGGHPLLALSDRVALVVTGESYEDLAPYFAWEDGLGERAMTFMIME